MRRERFSPRATHILLTTSIIPCFLPPPLPATEPLQTSSLFPQWKLNFYLRWVMQLRTTFYKWDGFFVVCCYHCVWILRLRNCEILLVRPTSGSEKGCQDSLGAVFSLCLLCPCPGEFLPGKISFSTDSSDVCSVDWCLLEAQLIWLFAAQLFCRPRAGAQSPLHHHCLHCVNLDLIEQDHTPTHHWGGWGLGYEAA